MFWMEGGYANVILWGIIMLFHIALPVIVIIITVSFINICRDFFKRSNYKSESAPSEKYSFK